MVLSGLIQPSQAIMPKPAAATATASAHCRNRVASRINTQSLIAPMVQKCPRWTNTPAISDKAKLAP